MAITLSKKLKKHNKGLVFTMDAVFAIVITIGIFSSAFFYLDKMNSTLHGPQNLLKHATDSLTVLEKDDTLVNTIHTSNTTPILAFLNATESSLCSNITLYDNSDNIAYTTTKSNCNTTSTSSTAKRSFIANESNIFYATMEIWYNEK